MLPSDSSNFKNSNQNSELSPEIKPGKAKKTKTKLQLKAPTQERSRQTVSTILDACSRILVKEGFFGVTTDKVAKEAGVSIGSLYQFFGNKESVVSALIQDLLRKDVESFKASRSRIEAAPLPERAELIVRSFLEIYRNTIDLRVRVHSIQNYLLESNFHRQYVDSYADLIQGLLPRLDSQRSSKRMASVMVNALIGLLNNALQEDPQFYNDEDFVQEVILLFSNYTRESN